jgi:hypothetical protein
MRNQNICGLFYSLSEEIECINEKLFEQLFNNYLILVVSREYIQNFHHVSSLRMKSEEFGSNSEWNGDLIPRQVVTNVLEEHADIIFIVHRI